MFLVAVDVVGMALVAAVEGVRQTRRSGMSSSQPPTMANATLQASSSTSVTHWDGSAASSGMASSLVAMNTASSVPGVMTRLAYRLEATALKPHCGTQPSSAPGMNPQRPPPARAPSMLSP